MKSKAPILQTVGLRARFGDRILFQGLSLSLDSEKVALIGRNGVGKSTLLHLLSGQVRAEQGTVTRRGEICFVPQWMAAGGMSPGQARREQLERALCSGADLLLLDEPTLDLDQGSVEWLRSRLLDWTQGLLLASHDRRLLRDFRHFFVMAESGCRYLSGSFDELEAELDREFHAQEVRYLRRLNHLDKVEERTLHSARRRKRKQQFGRVRELDRATPRSCLNQKRDQAQVGHGRINSLREERLNEAREWTKSARRSLKVSLPLALQVPVLAEDPGSAVIAALGISAVRDGRCLFSDLHLSLTRDRLAVTGPNGAGKTTLLQILAGARAPETGSVRTDLGRLGVIEQGGVNWMLEESLAEYLGRHLCPEEVGRRIVAQRFPLALAERPLRSLSPGERVRAALLGLLSHASAVEMLVLDEPTYSLDLLGQRSLTALLRAWSGGLLIASHNQEFLDSLGIERVLVLGG